MRKRNIGWIFLVFALAFALTACGRNGQTPPAAASAESAVSAKAESESAPSESAPSESTPSESAPSESAPPETAPPEIKEEEESSAETVEKNGEIYILYTSDIHCGIDSGFGLAGLKQVRDTLESQGYTTILVDDGDAIQGEPVGTLSEGETIIELMNAMPYDVAIPGNHEFDYGTDRFLELAGMAEFPYISCNFNKQGSMLFDPYVILEREGIRIAFVGVTTPTTIGESSPLYFQNEEGEIVYDFLRDQTGENLYAAVQSAVDAARAEGADLVYVMGHCGMEASAAPWTYADIIAHTRGIDVFFDGHSHDTEQVVMKNMDGEDVTRSACGTKMQCIGYSHISGEGEILETGIWSWPNKTSAPELLHIENAIGDKVEESLVALEEQLEEVIAHTAYPLTINDPEEVDASGAPIRMVRRAETNLGDLFADALRILGQADVSIVNGGGVRVDIDKGDITYGDILSVAPFGNNLCVIEVTGQDLLDALEWGVRSVPEENGSFPQVSGMQFTIDVSVESGCIEDEDGKLVTIEGERRVKEVTVGGEPIDPEQTYTLAGNDYMLIQIADGYTMFADAPVIKDNIKIDNQALIEYIRDTLGGEISEEYADPYGQGRITITEG